MTQQHHYFASFALGWATAETKDEAIEKLVTRFRDEFKRITGAQHKAGEPGAYFWYCKVLAPDTTPYKIEFYAPKGVEIDDAHHAYVTYVTNKHFAYWTHQKEL